VWLGRRVVAHAPFGLFVFVSCHSLCWCAHHARWREGAGAVLGRRARGRWQLGRRGNIDPSMTEHSRAKLCAHTPRRLRNTGVTTTSRPAVAYKQTISKRHRPIDEGHTPRIHEESNQPALRPGAPHPVHHHVEQRETVNPHRHTHNLRVVQDGRTTQNLVGPR